MTTEKLSVSFALNSFCPFGRDKVWFHLMFTFRRLALNSASKSSTMREKQEDLSSNRSFSRRSVRFLAAGNWDALSCTFDWIPMSMSEEQWISKSQTQFFVSLSQLWWPSAGLNTEFDALEVNILGHCCSLRQRTCVTPILGLHDYLIAVDCEQTQTVGMQLLKKLARAASLLGIHSIRIPFWLRSLSFESMKYLDMFSALRCWG